ncbi:hypothetical protein [Streptomyces winkii]|uniref:hypothetical protein n=1 Tax=Streptomyces winkii TaxID=3051178 RepID=UPI0028D1DD61|nr:hypothetical protein [Streptomyces sp. DSM 40971]
MIRFDPDQQRWVDNDADSARGQRHTESARQQRHVAKGGLALLAVCGLAFGTWALGWKDEPGQAAGQPSVVVPDPAATSRPDKSERSGLGEEPSDSTDPAGAAAADPPKGYEIAEDPEGFSLAVPEGWERRAEDRDGAQAVFYENSDRSKQLQVFYVEDSDPYESLKLAEANSEKNESYQRESLDRLDGGDGPAARLEYTYISDEHGAKRHVIDHRFEAEDGELYALIAYGPDEDGASADEKELLDTALTFFCPTGVDCGARNGQGDGDDGIG